ncbi:MAG: aquaporin [Bacteroidota bacterium]
MKKYVAELLGTFMLVFCGTGSIVINEVSEGVVGHGGIAFTFGLIVAAVIYAFGSLSGAHINPAVSIAFSVVGLFRGKDVLPYILVQITGAILASLLLQLLFPMQQSLGETLPSGSVLQSFVLELILTYILMLVILFVSQQDDVKQFTGFVVGGVVLMEAWFAGPICGASMNPARSIGPAIVSGNFYALQIYIIAPVLGAVMASFTWKYLKS